MTNTLEDSQDRLEFSAYRILKSRRSITFFEDTLISKQNRHSLISLNVTSENNGSKTLKMGAYI